MLGGFEPSQPIRQQGRGHVWLQELFIDEFDGGGDLALQQLSAGLNVIRVPSPDAADAPRNSSPHCSTGRSSPNRHGHRIDPGNATGRVRDVAGFGPVPTARRIRHRFKRFADPFGRPAGGRRRSVVGHAGCDRWSGLSRGVYGQPSGGRATDELASGRLDRSVAAVPRSPSPVR